MCWENVWFKGFYGNFVNFVYESFVIVICFFWSINPDFRTLVAWRGSLAQKMLGNGRELITRDSETCTYVPIRMADRSKYPDNSYQMPPFCLKYTQIIFFFLKLNLSCFSQQLYQCFWESVLTVVLRGSTEKGSVVKHFFLVPCFGVTMHWSMRIPSIKNPLELSLTQCFLNFFWQGTPYLHNIC